MRLLLVDHHPTFRLVASSMLMGLGHDVVEAGDSAEAEAKFSCEPMRFDAILTDVLLEGGLGPALVETLEAIRGYQIPVLFMAADPQICEVVGVHEGPRRRLIQKPFSTEALAAAMQFLRVH